MNQPTVVAPHPTDADGASGPAAGGTRCVVVAGMHRSGTSLTAGLLGRLGIDLGDRLIAADAANPRGYHEDADVVAFHGRVFRRALPRRALGHVDWGWARDATLDRDGLERFDAEARALIARRSGADRPWGFKDPRATLLLDFWDARLPDARYVCVYRAPWRVADSMQRLRADVFLAHPEFAAPIWTRYNAALLDFHRRHRDRSVLLNVDALTGQLDRLPAMLRRLGLEPLEVNLADAFDPDLLRPLDATDPTASLHAAAWPEVAALYEALEAEADLPAGPRRSPGIAALAPGSPGPVDVTVVIATRDDAASLVEALASVERCGLDGVEVIVVDAGTHDPECRRILDRLAARGIAIVRVPGSSRAAARNAGIARARGRDVLTLDADDRLRPGFLAAARAHLDADPSGSLGMVLGACQLTGRARDLVPAPEPDGTPRHPANANGTGVLFRRRLWEQLGGFDSRLSRLDGAEFARRAERHGWRSARLEDVAIDRVVRPVSRRDRLRAHWERFRDLGRMHLASRTRADGGPPPAPADRGAGGPPS